MKTTFSTLSLLVILTLQLAAINPAREYTMTPDLFKIEYQSIQLKTTDGAELAVWVMEPSIETKRDYTFVIAGSDAGNMGFSLPYAFYLLQQGIRVVTFDYRGFGASSDFEHRDDYLFHEEYITDLTTVLEWVKTKEWSSKTAVLAFSMGTWLAQVAYQNQPYDLLIAEAFIYDPKLVVERIKEQKEKQLVLPEDYDAKAIIEKEWTIPTLLIAGTFDLITQIEDASKFKEDSALVEVYVFEGDHLRGAEKMGMPTYIDLIVKML